MAFFLIVLRVHVHNLGDNKEQIFAKAAAEEESQVALAKEAQHSGIKLHGRNSNFYLIYSVVKN